MKKKKKYIPPKIEVIPLQVDDSILRASKITYQDPNNLEDSHTDEITDNDDEDFEAGAKKHSFNYNPWENDRVGY